MSTETALFAIVGFLATSLVGVLVWIYLQKLAADKEERKEHSDKIKDLDARMHAEEKVTIRQDGELNRIRDAHDRIADEMAGLATKDDVRRLEKLVERLLAKGSGGFPVTHVPRPDPIPRVDAESDPPKRKPIP